jgi:hypothetical protein
VEELPWAGTCSFPLPYGDHPCVRMHSTGGSRHVFLFRYGSLGCVSVTAYIVSAPCSLQIQNSGSNSFALVLIMQGEKES